MKSDSKWLSIALALAATTCTDAMAAITYPPGTTLEEVWASAPRIPPERAIDLLVPLFLDPVTEDETIDDEELEALKYLLANGRHAVEEPPAEPGGKRFSGEFDSDEMNPSESSFASGLSSALSDAIGLHEVLVSGEPTAPESGMRASSTPCVLDVPLFQAVKYRVDIGWQVDIFGIAAFAHNVRYGANNTDLVYGVFPFGVQMSWWDGFRCVAGGLPHDERELRACGRAKEWMIEGASQLQLTSSLEHVVPGVAQASVTYSGALVSGGAGTFRTSYQTRSTVDASWLLGPANHPLPSSMLPPGYCVGPYCPMGTNESAYYTFSQVLAWHPNIILNAAYVNPANRYYEVFDWRGHGAGNPHSVGDFRVIRQFRRYHGPMAICG